MRPHGQIAHSAYPGFPDISILNLSSLCCPTHTVFLTFTVKFPTIIRLNFFEFTFLFTWNLPLCLPPVYLFCRFQLKCHFFEKLFLALPAYIKYSSVYFKTSVSLHTIYHSFNYTVIYNYFYDCLVNVCFIHRLWLYKSQP